MALRNESDGSEMITSALCALPGVFYFGLALLWRTSSENWELVVGGHSVCSGMYLPE